jgi:hypothetical protein
MVPRKASSPNPRLNLEIERERESEGGTLVHGGRGAREGSRSGKGLRWPERMQTVAAVLQGEGDEGGGLREEGMGENEVNPHPTSLRGE